MLAMAWCTTASSAFDAASTAVSENVARAHARGIVERLRSVDMGGVHMSGAVQVWESNSSSRLYFVQIPKVSSTVTTAVLTAMDEKERALSPRTSTPGRYAMPFGCSPHAKRVFSQFAPREHQRTFTWTRDPVARFISGYYTETVISAQQFRAMDHWHLQREPDRFYQFVDDMAQLGTGHLPGHLALQAAHLGAVLDDCALALDYAWPLENGTATFWDVLEMALHLPHLGQIGVNAGAFQNKHDQQELADKQNTKLADQSDKTRRRFDNSQEVYDEYLDILRMTFAAFGTISATALPEHTLVVLCDLLAIDYDVLGDVLAPRPPACRARHSARRS